MRERIIIVVRSIVLNRLALVLAFGGIVVSGLLSLGHLLKVKLPCGAGAGCQTVAEHASSYWGGIPVAYYGFAAYLTLTILTILRGMRGARPGPLTSVAYYLSLVGTLVSFYLMYTAFTVIRTFCPWCLASAILMTGIFLTYAASLNAEPEPEPAPARESDEEAPPAAFGMVDTLLPVGLTFCSVLVLAMMGAMMLRGPKIDLREGAHALLTLESLVPESANVLGDPSAPVTVVEFADLECPACMEYAIQLKEYVKRNEARVRVVYRHLPLQMHEYAFPAATVGEMAAEKGRFWDYLDLMYARPSSQLDMNQILSAGQSVGVGADEAKRRMADDKDPAFERVYRDLDLANRLGLSVTPSFIVLKEGLKPEIVGSNGLIPLLNKPQYKTAAEAP